jgi:hypothetical protein
VEDFFEMKHSSVTLAARPQSEAMNTGFKNPRETVSFGVGKFF